MSDRAVVAVVLALGVAYAIWRGWPDRGVSRAAWILAQVATALALYLAIFPPLMPARGKVLVVLTPGATEAQLAQLDRTAPIVALPTVIAADGVATVPDLGTALRRYPATTSLRVVGDGLPARDRDSARGLGVSFDAAAIAHGIVELDAPGVVIAGRQWRVAGRVVGLAEGSVELRDPGDTPVATAPLDADGRFTVVAHVKGAGHSLYRLRLLDVARSEREVLNVPVVVRAGEALHFMVLAGGPNPEIKYLRRWALDAGFDLSAEVAVSAGVSLRDGSTSLDPAQLQRTDAVVIDDRAWAALGAAQKQNLGDAVRAGLGLLLRVTGPLPATVRDDWAALGWRIASADIAQGVTLINELGDDATASALTRRPLAVQSDGAVDLVRADDGVALAQWRPLGQGRVGLWWLTDTFRLVLDGRGEQYGSLWARALSTVARARAAQTPVLPDAARIDERAVICGVPDNALVEDGEQRQSALVVIAQQHGGRCAAYWPQTSGWHSLIASDQRWPFYVRAADEAPSLTRYATQEPTRALVGEATMAAGKTRTPMPRGPLFVAWVVLSALLWWWERRRRSLLPSGEGGA